MSLSTPKKRKVSVMLDLDLMEWAKEQPGGISETVRRLLRHEKDHQDREAQAHQNLPLVTLTDPTGAAQGTPGGSG